MSRPQDAIPLRPDLGAARDAPRDAIWALAKALFTAKVFGCNPADFLKGNRTAEILYRAAVTPAALAGSAFAQTAVWDLVTVTPGPTACAALFKAGMRVSFENTAVIKVPGRVTDSDDGGGFVAENDPILVRVLPLDAGPTLTPCKLPILCSFSDEVSEYTHGLDVITKMGSEALVQRLEKELFSNTAASANVRPAGLLNGITPGTAASAGTDAMALDIGTLIAALATAGAGTNPIFVAHPSQAAVMKAKVGTRFDYPIFPSNALAAKTVIAIEASSFVSGFDPIPRIDVTDQATWHESDTPAQLNTGGVTASPIRSGFQTMTSCLKLVIHCAWGMRAANHVAVLNNVNW